MKLSIVQLSDIHIRSPKDPVLGRAADIAISTLNVTSSPDAFLIAVTGDVAFSGSAEEYALAARFLADIKRRLENTGKPVFVVPVPGNHDLNFRSEPDTRPILLRSVCEDPDGVKPRGEIVRQILSVQNEFFEFEASILATPQRPAEERLVYKHVLDVGTDKILVNCFNTAWVSTNPELPGHLVFPLNAMHSEPGPAKLVISIFHHPYNWLAPDNARAFRHRIESTSDVVITGHEHESEVWVKNRSDGAVAQYVEGSVLQDASTGRSAFNTIVIDTDLNSYEATLCEWNGTLYSNSQSEPRSFIRNKLTCSSSFRNNPTFERVLRDPGLPILHPHKREVTLQDLYIYPALARKNQEKKLEAHRIIDGQRVVDFARATKYLLVVGDDTSGKTCLAKMLYQDLQRDSEAVPVLITGDKFDGLSERDVRKQVRESVASQYDQNSAELFFGLDLTRRVLIIDDWHKIKYAAKGKAAILEHLKQICGRIVCLTNRLYAIDELADLSPVRKALSDFEVCEIKEFGRRLTGKLIEKWHSLGHEYAGDVREYAHSVACSEQKILAVIGKGILPTYPIFLIGLLQADSSPGASAQNAGSYGHILESLITARLADVSARSTDVGLMYTYTSRIAYYLFKKDRSFLSPRELSELHEQYCERYKMNQPEARLIADLVKAKILRREGGSYEFTYRGCYCYFVARFFAENIGSGDAGLRSELNAMTDRLAWEDYKNIVMFFLYLTRDGDVIERLLANAAKIYEECDPCNLEEDIGFVNSLLKDKPKSLELPSTDVQRNRDEYRSQQDRDDETRQQQEQAPDQRVPYESGLNEIVKIVIALQSLRVMGQVLRNFPGVLTAEPKYRLAEASYLLGLRLMRRLFILAEQQSEMLRTAYASIYMERHPLATIEEVATSADQMLIWLIGAAAFGVIKRICNSVGLEELELTFQDVREKLDHKLSVRLIDLAIQLEYFSGAPEAEIYDLEKDVQGNHFAYKILRDLVAEFLYLHNTDTQVFQRLGQLLKIQTRNPQFLLNKAVRTSE